MADQRARSVLRGYSRERADTAIHVSRWRMAPCDHRVGSRMNHHNVTGIDLQKPVSKIVRKMD